MRIVLLGPPGSGKGELAEKIAQTFGIPIITQSSVVDEVAAEPGELGRLAAEARDTSRVSDELLMALLRIQLPKLDLKRGYLLVDMPRDSGQADVLDAMLNDLGKPIDLVIKLDVDMDELMERLVGRVRCEYCGAEYNMYVNPPLVEGVCDECGARVRRRPPDYEETISNRLRVYEGQMGPLLQYYDQGGKLRRFDATGETDPLWKEVKAVIDATPSIEVQPAEPEPRAAKGEQQSGGKATAKKATAKKAATKKATARKATARKATAKKTTAKKTTAKKTTAKKTTAKKATAKKATAKKATAKKATAKKAATKKAATKKAATKKAATKKAATKKATAKKATAKKATAKKATAKKAATKKATAKQTTGKRPRR